MNLYHMIDDFNIMYQPTSPILTNNRYGRVFRGKKLISWESSHVLSAEQLFPDYVAIYVHDVQLLVDAGANPHLADNNGRTACYYNRMHGYIISSECIGCSSDDDCDECCGGCTGNCNDVVE